MKAFRVRPRDRGRTLFETESMQEFFAEQRLDRAMKKEENGNPILDCRLETTL